MVWVVVATALGARLSGAALAAGAGTPDVKSAQDALEDKANQLLSERLDAHRFLVYAKVETQAAAKAQSGKKVHLPFVPVDIDPDVLDHLMGGTEQAKDLKQLQFTLTLVVDDTVDQDVVSTLTTVLKERFEIDDSMRHLTIKKAKLYAPPPKEAPVPVPVPVLPPNEAEKSKLEAEAARARLESERERLEMSRKEIEYQRNLATLEGTLRTEQDQAVRDKDKAAKEKAAVEVAAQKQRDAGDKPVAMPAAPPKSALDVLSSLQHLIIGLLGLVGIIVVGFVLGTSLKKAMGAVGDGIKAAGSGIGTALADKGKEDGSATAGGEAEAGTAALEAGKEGGAGGGDWTPGNKDYDAFLGQVQDKIEVLSRERNTSLRQAIADLIETDAGLMTAAAVILALPPSAARFLIEDLPTDQVRKLKSFLELPAAVSKAKVMRHIALQEFYGRIAGDEFTDSPLSHLKNSGWLTRMSTSELASFAVSLPAAQRAVFLACLSPFRIAKMMEKAASPKDKETLLGAIAGIGKVTEDDMMKFIQDRERETELAEKAGKVKPAVDQFLYLETIAQALQPEDQQALLAAVAGQGKVHSHLSRRILPFAAIKGVPHDIVRDLLDKRSVSQTASILFAADAGVQDYVLAALSGVKAEAIRDELKVMTEKTSYAKKFQVSSLKQQREIANYLIRLADEGTLDIEKLLSAASSRAPATGTGEAPLRTNTKGAA